MPSRPSGTSGPSGFDLSGFVCLGVVGAAHGVKGLVRLKAFTEKPCDIAAYGDVVLDDGRRFALSIKGAGKGAGKNSGRDLVLVAFEGITSRDAAETLKGRLVYIARSQLPPLNNDEKESGKEGDIYHADLIGAWVCDPKKGRIGQISGVFDFGGGEILELNLSEGAADGAKVLVPFRTEARLDGDSLFMEIDPIWLEEAQPQQAQKQEKHRHE